MSARTPVQRPGKIQLPGSFAAPPDSAGAGLPRGHYLGGGVSEMLDLLRAGSAALVVVVHARLHVMGDLPEVRAASGELTARVVASLSMGGAMAVFVFFVLSGYLIGGQVLNAPRRDGRFWTSYGVNRFSRITIVTVPAVLISVAAAYGSNALWGVSYTAKSERCLPGAWDVAGNLLHLQKVVVRPICSDGPIWSIANEVFYYVLFPLVFVAVRGATGRARMLAVVGVALLVAYGLREPAGSGGMLAYFGAWMLGAAVAYPFAPGRRGRLLLAAAVALSLAGATWGREPGIHYYYGSAAATAGSLLLARRWGAPAWMLRPRVKRVAHGMAAFSFSLYLFHMPAMNLARGAFGIPPAVGEVSVATFSLSAALVVLGYAAGAAAWWLFERHTLRLRAVVSRCVGGPLARPAEVVPAARSRWMRRPA